MYIYTYVCVCVCVGVCVCVCVCLCVCVCVCVCGNRINFFTMAGTVGKRTNAQCRISVSHQILSTKPQLLIRPT